MKDLRKNETQTTLETVEMKKIILALAILYVFTLTSCTQPSEINESDIEIEKDSTPIGEVTQEPEDISIEEVIPEESKKQQNMINTDLQCDNYEVYDGVIMISKEYYLNETKRQYSCFGKAVIEFELTPDLAKIGCNTEYVQDINIDKELVAIHCTCNFCTEDIGSYDITGMKI